MQRRLSMVGVIGIVLMSLSCGSDDDGGGPSGPGGGSTTNPLAAGFGAVADAHALVVEANAATYASMTTFGPAILQSLLSPPPLRQRTVAQESCLPASMQNTVFAYDTDQGQYVPTAMTGAPPDGARYVLYEVDSEGAPVEPLVEAGYFDVACDAAADTVAASVTNASEVNIFGVQLIVLFASGSDFIITTSPGELSSPNGDFTLDVLFTAQSNLPVYEMGTSLSVLGLDEMAAGLEGFRAGTGLWDATLTDGMPAPPYSAFSVGGSQFTASINWGASTTTSVMPDSTLRNINQGEFAPLEYEDYTHTTNGVLACFSGNYLVPTVEASNTNEGFGCATGVIERQIVLSATDLAAIQAGSAALADMLESMSRVLSVALPVIQ